MGEEGATKYAYDEVYQLWFEENTLQELSEFTGASDGTIQNILRANSVLPEKIHERVYSKPVIQFTTKGEYVCTHPSANKVFPSCEAAAKELGMSSGTPINRCARGERKTAYGFKWKYAREV